jgi:hypothetical protein
MRHPALTLAVLVSACLAGVSPAWAAHADCGYRAVTITGTATEVERGCAALSNVLETFAAMGFQVEPQFTLVFKDAVFVDLVADAVGSRSAPGRQRVSAYFDARRKRIEATSFQSRQQNDRRPWTIDWGPEVAESVLHHEFAHMATFAVLAGDHHHVGRAWLEYIAYSVEFHVMSPTLRQRILSRSADTKPFASELEVNPLLLALEPDQFGIRSHLTTQAKGGLDFLRRILIGDVEFSRGDILWRP